jgi:hydroxymethylglutaryl-CoA lyase
VATEDVVYMLHGMGIKTGIDMDALCDASTRIAALVGHELPGKYLKAHRRGRT